MSSAVTPSFKKNTKYYVKNILSAWKIYVKFTHQYLSRGGFKAVSIGMDPDSDCKLDRYSGSDRPSVSVSPQRNRRVTASAKWRNPGYTRIFIGQPLTGLDRLR